MKKIITTLLAIAICGVSVYASSDAEVRKALKSNTTSTITKAFCSSKMFTQCYSVSSGECKAALVPFLDECFSKNESMITAKSSRDELSSIGNTIGLCASKMYNQKFSSKADQNCIKNEAKNFQK